jgi:ABC-type sugar transport system permease subunit
MDVVGSGRPSIEAIHRDIALANQYRIEMIRYLLVIAAALFAFTTSFRPLLAEVHFSHLMWIGWLSLGVSMLGGILQLHGWDHYYKSYRDYDHKFEALSEGKRLGREARKRMNRWRMMATILQFVGFVIGVACIGGFAAVNVDNARQVENPSRTICFTPMPPKH